MLSGAECSVDGYREHVPFVNALFHLFVWLKFSFCSGRSSSRVTCAWAMVRWWTGTFFCSCFPPGRTMEHKHKQEQSAHNAWSMFSMMLPKHWETRGRTESTKHNAWARMLLHAGTRQDSRLSKHRFSAKWIHSAYSRTNGNETNFTTQKGKEKKNQATRNKN